MLVRKAYRNVNKSLENTVRKVIKIEFRHQKIIETGRLSYNLRKFRADQMHLSASAW